MLLLTKIAFAANGAPSMPQSPKAKRTYKIKLSPWRTDGASVTWIVQGSVVAMPHWLAERSPAFRKSVEALRGVQSLAYWVFQAKKMDVATSIPGNDSISDECTTISCNIARKCGNHFARLNIPYLHRLVP